MKLLITGANSGLAEALVILCGKDPEITIHTSSRQSSLRENHVICDLSCAGQINELVDQVCPTHVIHLAASYQNDLREDLIVNALSAATLASALSKINKRTRLLLAGSAAEYGIPPPGIPVSEDNSPRPLSLYGLTKAIQTQIGYYYADTQALDVITARIFNILGPSMSDRLFVGAVEKQLDMYKSGQISALTLGNLDSFRDYIAVEDAAQALILLVRHGASGKVYNVGSGIPTRMDSILATMLDKAGLSDIPITRKMPQPDPSSYDISCIYADISALSLLRGRFPA